MKIVRKTISLPERVFRLAQEDAGDRAVNFSTYVRLLIEQRLGVGFEREVPKRAEGDAPNATGRT